MPSEQLAFSPACERNKQPILDVLQQALPAHGHLLEIGAGTGQHAMHFAKALPGIDWQPTDRDTDSHAWHSLCARVRQAQLPNLAPPLALDVLTPVQLPQTQYDAIYSANTAHIMPWPAVVEMFRLAGQALAQGGRFLLYGPFNRHGEYTSPSNRDFDHSLKARDPAMGLRDLADIERLAGDNQFTVQHEYSMPSNNLMLCMIKRS